MKAATRGERAYDLELREVERVVRLVEKDAAALAHDGKVGKPTTEVHNVVLGHLYALGPTRGARGENDVLSLLACHPHLSRERLCRGARAEELAGVEDAGVWQRACEGIGRVASRQ